MHSTYRDKRISLTLCIARNANQKILKDQVKTFVIEAYNKKMAEAPKAKL